MDTKAFEIECVARHIRENWKMKVLVVDVTTFDIDTTKTKVTPLRPQPDVPREYLLKLNGSGANTDGKNNVEDRREKEKKMSDGLINYCRSLIDADDDDLFSGIIGIGGSCGTAIITPAMRFLPIGFPKIMVSTMASGDVGAYVGCTDVTLMHSVADIAGLNAVTRVVLENAGAAVASMAIGWAKRTAATTKDTPQINAKPTIGMTQFGVTTLCCEAVRKELENDYEIVTFHATGAGGRAMEKLLKDGHLKGVLDLTTTEIADEIGGGVLTAGPERLDAFASAEVPMVMSLGALDMVNFGGEKSVPSKFSGRKLHVHKADGWAKRNAAATKKAKLANRTKKKPTLGMTQFGVTTVCCEAVRKELENDYEVVTFHATGAGGRAMEKLMEDGLLSGVLDLTTTEIADEIGGGVLSAGPERLDAFASAKVPMVMSLGALDMVNFGGEKTVPSKLSGRKLHVHNSEVTLMRTSEEECRKIASFIAKKFNKSVAPAVLLIPSKGVSLIDVPDMPFYDPTVDAALFDELKSAIKERSGDSGNGALRKVVTIDCAINDPEFAVEVAKWYRLLVKNKRMITYFNISNHNSEVTLMRTSEEECRKIASFIAKKFNKSVAPAVLLIPSKGVSLIDVPGMPFYDPTVDTVLFDELNRLIEERDGDGGKGALRKVVTIDCAINDPEFAVEVAKWYRKLAKLV
eukprot:CAMPEP_0198276452 /NCGR_PEP_ID=MMETSP1447-20131203/65316_1 /TAXON_ID=420782 /ORGANISM="Chaetoceros dichaeta, Strain CCMP1751" /LENGTH=689 /DNA_ID=CAMNT_0043971405 /DNA_START=145 /DNA_END=2215 /DNA_ORIENTATION=+